MACNEKISIWNKKLLGWDKKMDNWYKRLTTCNKSVMACINTYKKPVPKSAVYVLKMMPIGTTILVAILIFARIAVEMWTSSVLFAVPQWRPFSHCIHKIMPLNYY